MSLQLNLFVFRPSDEQIPIKMISKKTSKLFPATGIFSFI
ncbi:MAG: hypothetical protein ACI8UX_002299, partial [Psychromonas sp.]